MKRNEDRRKIDADRKRKAAERAHPSTGQPDSVDDETTATDRHLHIIPNDEEPPSGPQT